MKQQKHLDAIRKSGLKIGYIADELKVHRTMLSRWLNGLEGSKINHKHIAKLNEMLKIED